jgi:hypothetical protein
LYADWNNDEDFDEENETLFSNDPWTAMEVKGSFTIPSNIKLGTYRLRIVLGNSNLEKPTACRASRGEIEDYKLEYANLSTEKFNSFKEIYCYPNPASNILNIQIPDNIHIEKVSIYDFNSRKLIDQKLESKQINIENLSSGVYFIEFSDGNTNYKSKFIKI